MCNDFNFDLEQLVTSFNQFGSTYIGLEWQLLYTNASAGRLGVWDELKDYFRCQLSGM
jgi:hypothetical protein